MTWRRVTVTPCPTPIVSAACLGHDAWGDDCTKAAGRQRKTARGRPAREPSCPGAAQLYFCSSAVGGMRPVFLIVANAPGDERYWISNLAAAGSFAREATPAENTVTF